MTGASFPGFPDRMRYFPVPASFFGALLRDVDSLAELKLLLYCWRVLQQKKGGLRFVRAAELQADRALLMALRNTGPEPPDQILEVALGACRERGVLLAIELESEQGGERCYFLNTNANRQAIARIEAGEIELGPFRPLARAELPPPLPQPGIFELYEQNIGLLTPMIAEELRDADLRYPPEWVEDAFREAVAYNKRNWRYIRRVLENWAVQGRGDSGETRRYPQPPEDPRAYLEGRYGRLLKR